MARCTVSLEGIDPRRSFSEGETIDVVVRVDAESSVSCKALTVELGWQTHGKGNIDSRSIWSERLFAGELPQGVETYACSIPVPGVTLARPATYHGHFINIDWFVRVRVDIPWAIDPKDEKRVYLAQREAANGAPALAPAELAPVELGGTLGPLLVFATVLLGAGTFAAFRNPWIAAALVAPAMLIFRRFWREVALLKRIGQVRFGVSPTEGTMGAPLRGHVEITPPADLVADSVSVTLRATERATSGSGTDKTTHAHVALQESRVVAQDALLPGGATFSADATFDVPRDAPPTFDAPNNKITWTVELAVVAGGAKPLTFTRVVPFAPPGLERGRSVTGT